MSFYRKSLGEKGEKAAEKALKRRGYHLLQRNYRVRGGEIDLIMEKESEIVFVEVKTRTSTRCGTPLDGIDHRKQERLRHAAQVYLCQNHLENVAVSFCAVAVMANAEGDVQNVEIFENIFFS